MVFLVLIEMYTAESGLSRMTCVEQPHKNDTQIFYAKEEEPVDRKSFVQ